MRPGAAALAVFLLTGCAGGRVYENNIRHVCLCAVRTVRAHGYVVQEQDFNQSNGTLVAAFSIPDLKGTMMSGNLTNRAGAFIWNAWEHTKLDTGKGGGKRVRIEERVVAKFKASGGGLLGWLDWNSGNRTTVNLTADVTDYGEGDWVFRRTDRDKAYRESLLKAVTDCLAGRQVVASAPPRLPEPEVMVVEPVPAAQVVSAPGKPKPPVVVRRPPVQVAKVAVPGPEPEPEKLEEREVREMLVSARGSYDGGNYQDAIATLERVTRADPQNAEALGYLGAAYHQVGRNSDAVVVYERYLKLVPGDYRTRDFVEELRGK